MTFKRWFEQISQRTGPAFGVGPAGFSSVLKQLGNPQQNYQIIHVAGTNGKGSVCYLCASVLQAAGYQTGLFISPHLQHPTERIQVNGEKISGRTFRQLGDQVLACHKNLNFFELVTAIAFLYFAQKKVQWVALETGMGGRKDPTNACRPAACVITSIGLDHCHILGNTLPKIAREKAGIIKKNVPVFIPQFPSEIMAVVRQIAKQKQAPLHIVKRNRPFELVSIDWKKADLILQKNTSRWRLHLLGEKQVQNACLVYQLFHYLGMRETAIRRGFAQVQVPARFEMIRRWKKVVILDGAHNPQAVENLVKFVQKSPGAGKMAVVCGFMADKDYPSMVRLLAKHAAALYITTPGGARGATLNQIKSVLPHSYKTKFFLSMRKALFTALSTYPVVLVTGSFYLMKSAKTHLGVK